MRGRRPAVGLCALAVALAPACSGQLEVTPGNARPAASASDGFRMNSGDTLHSFNGMNLVLPAGWSARASGSCLTPPGVSGKTRDDCPPSGLRVLPRASEMGYIDAQGTELDTPAGYWRPWTSCPGEASEAGSGWPVAAERGERSSFTLVSGERVESAAWILTCADGTRFDTRIWYVPEADVEFDATIVLEKHASGYDAIVRSADLSDYDNDQ